MTCKTLTLAAQQTCEQLGQLLGDPCPGASCTKVCGYPTRRYEDPRDKATCPLSWGHCDSLPAKLTTDPCSLKVCALLARTCCAGMSG